METYTKLVTPEQKKW